MATDPQAVQILTTLEYLGKYNKVDCFGLILQVGVGSLPNGTLTVTPAVQNLLQPWMWWDPTKPQPAAPAGPLSPLNLQQLPIQLWQTSGDPSAAVPLNPDVVAVPVSSTGAFKGKPFQLDPSITTQLSKDCVSAITSGDLLWTESSVSGVSRGAGQNMYPWPAHIAQVARYPYPIPHLLNLCFFLKVTDANFKPNSASMSYFATLNFSASVAGATVTYNAPSVVQFQPVKNSRLVIPLINSASISDQSVAITTQPLIGPLAAATRVLATKDHTPETSDWQAHLSSSVADTFDLSARIVNTVRSACDQNNTKLTGMVAADFTGLITSVLTAQREIVAYGCQSGANGQSLLKRLLNAWVDATTDPAKSDPGNAIFADAFEKAICKQRTTDQSDTAPDLIAYYRWIDTLGRQAAFRGNDLLPTLMDGSTAISSAGLTPFDPSKIYQAKDKPAVVYNGRPYLAIADVGPAASVDAAHWRCLLPSIAFYEPGKTYYGGEQVLFNDKLYQAPTGATGPGSAPPGAPWIALSAFAPGVQVAKLPDKLLAVEHLQLQFTQPDVLSKLLLQQWQDFFSKPEKSGPIQTVMGGKSAGAAFQSFLTSATANLAQWDVRGLLLQCNLNTSWATITKSANDRVALRAAIKTELNTRLGAGLLNKLPGSEGSVPSFASSNPSILTEVGAWSDQRTSLIVPLPLDTSSGPTPAADKADPQPTRAAQGLSVMVDTLLSNTTDDQDPLRTLSGLCVLMRQTGTTPWRCLNAGIPTATVTSPLPDPAVQDPASPATLGRPVVIPMPLHYQDGLRRATFTYNNQPIMCSSPAHGFSDGLVPKPTRDQSRNFDRLISYQHFSVTQDLQTAPNDAWKIPGLAFDRSYDFLLATVSNSGALPPEFADPVLGPGVFSFASAQNARNATGNLLPPSIAAIPYRRTVPISDLRFASLDASGAPAQSGSTLDKLSLPAIPADVQPRASEIFGSKLLDDRRGKSQLATAATPGKPSHPLLLLSPYFPANSSYTLLVRKPTIDFLTWDRAQATLSDTDPSDPRNQRISAWQLFNTHARRQDSNFDLSLEDYAIESLTLEAKDEKGNIIPCAGQSTLKWTDAKIQDPATAKRLQSVQPPIQIKVSTSVGGTLKLQGQQVPTPNDPPTFTLSLPPGFLGHIKLTANLKSTSNKHFARNILPKPDGYKILVETALADFPQPSDLQGRLTIMPPLTAAGPVQFTLTAPNSADALAGKWKQISRVDLQTQTWRWDGRPAPMFPFEDLVKVSYYGGASAWPVPMPPPTEMPTPAAQPATKKLLEWELEAFATRSADDYTVRPMARRNANFGATDDRGTELGATYYRAGVTAWNRYGSLVPRDNRSAATLNTFAGIPGTDGAWVRRFVPGRYTADGTLPTHKDAAGNVVLDYTPPKPAIKYIVPLTGAFDASRPAASSVLVVLQGPWFAIAGLAEDISVRILTSDPQDHPYQLPEAGPDPIYYQGSSQLPSGYGPYGSPFVPVEPAGQAAPLFHGPVGHTFDSSDTNPLWVTSSFVLDPPSVNPGPDAAQEGTFACVQFARKLLQQGMVETDSTKTPTALVPSTRGDLTSPYTDPVWVQFLASRYLPVGSAPDFSLLTLVYDELNQKVTLYDPSDRRNAMKLTQALRLTHALHPLYTDAADYTFALLLTQQVPDLLGRSGQERFVDMLLEPGGDTSDSACWKWPIPSGGVPRRGIDTNRLIGRLVVIQRQVNTSAKCDPKAATASKPICDLGKASDLWTELFPKDSTQDAVSRIIAVSPPIPQFNRSAPRQTCIVDSASSPAVAGGGK